MFIIVRHLSLGYSSRSNDAWRPRSQLTWMARTGSYWTSAVSVTRPTKPPWKRSRPRGLAGSPRPWPITTPCSTSIFSTGTRACSPKCSITTGKQSHESFGLRRGFFFCFFFLSLVARPRKSISDCRRYVSPRI